MFASSIMRGRDTETDRSLAEIGEAIGFEIPAIGVRHIDRNKRMMPAGKKIDLDSQIQQRMHEEYVIGFYKPTRGEVRGKENFEIPKMRWGKTTAGETPISYSAIPPFGPFLAVNASGKNESRTPCLVN